ncbi:hypothetical protein BJ138DRAFT_1182676 [Hygrophoropsis aurantiaca]|uniref:Uncharacterized protein n=1 Tax=Hygrophoropsis aurantiaca TaxID=72124 RepID=A0ACB8A180_9AGAM|nr:hypothetical protein BJ138DRAFT_1182676 [Hygrophoropsis aurantiaca]
MGTRGYTVYRYKKYYFSAYRHCDSYPECLGEEVLRQARSKRYLETLKATLQEKISEFEGMKSDAERARFLSDQDETDSSELYMSTTPQGCDIMIEWVYEIDMDRNVFHVNGVPFFSLDNLPPRSVALERLISTDSYGNEACKDPKYRFEAIQPPAFEETALSAYRQRLSNGQSQVPYTAMLDLSEHTTHGETLRTRYLQTIVGYSMDRSMAFAAIQEFRLAKDRSEITYKAWQEAFAFASAAFAPPVYFSFWEGPQGKRRLPERKDVSWVRGDVFIHITPHLADENHMQAAIARVVEDVLGQDKEGVVFGVLFSFLHCVIVRIDLLAGGMFTHTAPMPFVPSWFAKEPSTLGITALSRFGYRRDPDLFRKALAFHSDAKATPGAADEHVGEAGISASAPAEPAPWVPNPVDSSCSRDHCDAQAAGSKIPLEIFYRIALSLPSIDSLLEFGLVAKICQEAAEMVLQCPHIDSWRLVGVDDTYALAGAETGACVQPEEEDDDDDATDSDTSSSGPGPVDSPNLTTPQLPKPELQCTKFLAIRGDGHAELWLGKRRHGKKPAYKTCLRVFPTARSRKHRGVPLSVVVQPDFREYG